MYRKLKHNRPICYGDLHQKSRATETIHEVMERIKKYDTDFLYKIVRENSNPIWNEAAQIVIDERIAAESEEAKRTA